ncbi:hypothetical protein K3495_g2991 [Podosphaera aphanis]|nr:hypothetical protein K3495_g2991 [Podosphaera aphanis]
MPITKITSAPSLESFTPLAEHQSQTPSSFHEGKPILHYYDHGARLLVSDDHRSWFPLANSDVANGAPTKTTAVDKFQTFVSTENITLFNVAESVGVTIPYPSISLHAIQRIKAPEDPEQEVKGLYMQLEISAVGASEDDDQDLVYPDLTLIPSPSSDPAKPNIQTLFDAVSACCNLYPDHSLDIDEEMEDIDAGNNVAFHGTVGYNGMSAIQQLTWHDGMPPALPGSSGWITAENVNEYFDGEGNWIGGDERIQPLVEQPLSEEVTIEMDTAINEDGETPSEGAGRARTITERDGDESSDAERKAEEAKRARKD